MMTESWRDFMYEDEETGERFFVELDINSFDSIYDAKICADEIATENFSNPVFICAISQREADRLGYDTF